MKGKKYEHDATLPLSNPLGEPQVGTTDGKSLERGHQHPQSDQRGTASLLLEQQPQKRAPGRPRASDSQLLAREEAHCGLTTNAQALDAALAAAPTRPLNEGSSHVAISKEITDQLLAAVQRSQTNPVPWSVSIFVSFAQQVHWKEVVRAYADDQIGAHALAIAQVADRIELNPYDELSIVAERVPLSSQVPPDARM
jgi:hypothetical protein